ncbi:glycosyltransferase family 4 protein [Rugamonas rubra]|uniref:Glycosyltransferase involved in cell wall bisynthesis n=1 Tax=Rugamonas rubra TaxID=758825 RepID=A0A1I4L065_9BURK|nr:glycosyltransferase family 4 protein [Rugamonas rubra]SFL84394.1 Glycosyltransferase involved in cell wall bisynthesis [Rugamonas rubra]
MKKIVMIGTRFDTMGGISAVVNVYRAAGLFERLPIEYIATHCDGGAGAKLRILAAALWRFAGLLLRGQVGLLHVHVSRRASFWRKSVFFLAAFAFRVPAVLHLHSGAFHDFYERDCGAVKKRLVRYVFDHAAHVVVLSQTWKSWVASISGNRHITAIYNPVLLAEPAGDEARVAGQTLFLGRLGHNKGSYDLLSAAAAVRAAQPGLPLRLQLGGDGEVEQVRARAQALGIADRVDLLGWVSSADKAARLARAVVYVLPSYSEGLPMSVLEAMAAGLPVLTTPVGGIPEAVSDGVEGFLVAPGDVAALAERWSRLLADPALARRMGEAARRKVASTFSAQAVLPQLESVYLSLGFAAR